MKMSRTPGWLLLLVLGISAPCIRSSETARLRSLTCEPEAISPQILFTEAPPGVVVLGKPRPVEVDGISALRFAGQGDAVVMKRNPLEALREFTISVHIRPDSHGAAEQRFLHLEDRLGRRLLLELRLDEGGDWALDSFVKTRREERVLLDRKRRHSAGEWHLVVLRCDGREIAAFVDGAKELSGRVDFEPMDEGECSLGARLNRVFWFTGELGNVRIYPCALTDDTISSMHPGPNG
jgi:Concanavalin A-like lectin/glucanases superfamily